MVHNPAPGSGEAGTWSSRNFLFANLRQQCQYFIPNSSVNPQQLNLVLVFPPIFMVGAMNEFGYKVLNQIAYTIKDQNDITLLVLVVQHSQTASLVADFRGWSAL